MKYKILTLFALTCAISISAQIAEIKSTVPLLSGVESNMYYPVLSEDGQKLLFTSDNYTGLKMYDYKDDITVKISDEVRAGFDALFSSDGSIVYYVSQHFINGRNMRQVKSYDVQTKSIKAESPVGRFVSRPAVLNGGVAAMVDGKSVVTAKNTLSVRTEGSKLYITRNGIEQAFQPVESYAGYLWASLSPDKTKVLFFAAGKGVYVVNLKGKIIAELGNYESPVWYGNDCVVAMNAKHNGYQHISSQIVMMKVDGSAFQELTKPESMAMNPTASYDAGKIVYNTIDGRLYQMNITLK